MLVFGLFGLCVVFFFLIRFLCLMLSYIVSEFVMNIDE